MKTSPDFLVSLAERLGWALLHSLWQGALIALVLAVALHWLRRNRAATRHAVCLFAMMLLAASVAGTAWRIRPASAAAHGSRPLVENAARGGMQAEPAAPLPAPDISFEIAPLPDRASSAPGGAVTSSTRSWREQLEPLLPWISAMWMAGVALLTLRHFAGWRRRRAPSP